MVTEIREVAEEVGINAFITNSNDKIDVQLSRLTREGDSPIMLITWDIDNNLTFDNNGFLQNPSQNIVALLVSKPEDLTKDEAEKVAKEMGDLFQVFIQKLYNVLSVQMSDRDIAPITNATYKYVPIHGSGKHSGILARWTQRSVTSGTCYG